MSSNGSDFIVLPDDLAIADVAVAVAVKDVGVSWGFFVTRSSMKAFGAADVLGVSDLMAEVAS